MRKAADVLTRDVITVTPNTLVTEAARVLDVSKRTVERDWRYARAWLLRALSEADA